MYYWNKYLNWNLLTSEANGFCVLALFHVSTILDSSLTIITDHDLINTLNKTETNLSLTLLRYFN